MTLDVDQVCTDADLEIYTLGKDGLQALLPDDWLDGSTKTAKPARELALYNVLQSLGRRVPPIVDTDLVEPRELKTAVALGTLEILHTERIEHAESPHIKKAKYYGESYRAERDSLQPSVRAGATASSIALRMSCG